MSDEYKRPPMWEIWLEVVTPDDQLLSMKLTHPPDYMDKSFMEYLLDKVQREIVYQLKNREYFN